jgi:protein ImuB
MDRLACVSLPALPLQLLLARRPEWLGRPAAVVAQDKPQGEILWATREARRLGVAPGMRYDQGLGLAPDLQAAEVPAGEIAAEVDALADELRRFSPDVEISAAEPGVFWLGGKGLALLFASASAWARAIHQALVERGRQATVVVGFRRFAVYAVAKSRQGALVFAGAPDEEAALRRTSLAALAVDADLRATLDKLGVRTVGDFLKLPPQGVRRRFGPEAAKLHALAAGLGHEPLVPAPPFEPIAETAILDESEENAVALLFLIRRHLHPLLYRLAERAAALRELEIRFALEGAEPRTDRIRPAEPTLDDALILDLVRLRLEAAPLPAPAAELGLTAHAAPAERRQLELFFEKPRRDLAAADRALARLRAELGDAAVLRARLTEGHLPEARFVWEPLEHLAFAEPRAAAPPTLIRRVFAQPAPQGPRARPEPDSWSIRSLQCGAVLQTWGPYIVSGGWQRRETHRRYYFLETQNGCLLWVYYDAGVRRWFVQGQVE